MPAKTPKAARAPDITKAKAFWPRILNIISKSWVVLVAPGAIIMVGVVWMMILIETVNHFRRTEGLYLGNTVQKYSGSPTQGYVDGTNIPKHLGSAVWTCLFGASMMFWLIFAFFAEIMWRFTFSYKFLAAMRLNGLYEGRYDGAARAEYLWIWSIGLLKVWIGIVTAPQTFVGLYPDNKYIDTPLFCLYAVLILIISTPFTALAQYVVYRRQDTHPEPVTVSKV